ncbi:MAG: DoxX family protein [Burkholderiales bacterium]|nr:DoxX family protein [Burkholderiales bacterium]
MSHSLRYIPVLGRVLMGAPFVLTGLFKLGSYAATVGYIASVGLPFAPLGWAIAVAVEIGGGLLLISGYRVRIVALLLALFSLVTAAIFHNHLADQNQLIHFLKNIMMAGGLLQLVYFGAGPASLDARSVKPALAH